MKNILILIFLFFGHNCFAKSILYTYLSDSLSNYQVGGYIKLPDYKEKYGDRLILENYINRYNKLIKEEPCSEKNNFENFIENFDEHNCSLISTLKKEYLLTNNKEGLSDLELTLKWKKEDKENNKYSTYRILQIKEINDKKFLVIEKAF